MRVFSALNIIFAFSEVIFKDTPEIALGCCGPGKLPKKGKSPEGGYERVQKVFSDPASKRPLALVRNGVAPVGGAKTLGRPLLPGPKRSQKDLLHPPLTTFGRLSTFGQFLRSTASQK